MSDEDSFYEWVKKQYKFNQKPKTKDEWKLIKEYGKNIRLYDELDPSFIAIEDGWLPIPVMLNEKDIMKNQKKLEDYLFNSGFTINTGESPKPKRRNSRVYANKIQQYKALLDVQNQRFSRKIRIPIPEWVKQEVHALKGYACEDCREKRFDEYHHINENPSDNRVDNIAILCYRCHKNLHSRNQ